MPDPEQDMPRSILDENRIHPAVRERIASLNADIVQEVELAKLLA